MAGGTSEDQDLVRLAARDQCECKSERKWENVHGRSFQLAGSIVLLIYGLHLVFERFQADDSLDVNSTEGLVARAAYPLAIPGLAGPGSMMTVTLLTENYARSIVQQAQTVGLMALCLVVVVLIFFAAQPISRAIGRGGLATVSRVMGLILSSIAVTNGVKAIKVIFGLA